MKQHISNAKQQTPLTLYKSTYNDPLQRLGAHINKHPQYPANSNFLKFDRMLKSHYETVNDKLWN